MNSIASTPGALRILAGSVVARLPLTMIGIGLLVHVQHLTGSFADAGIVDGAYGLALGVGGPPLGRLADRRGQTGVLVATSVASGVLLVGLAALPIGAPVLCQVALAALLGLVTPPVGACLRALLPDVLADPDALHASFAVDATAVELTWVVGSALALALGSAVSSGFALAATGFVILAATQPSRPSRRRGRGVRLRVDRPRAVAPCEARHCACWSWHWSASACSSGPSRSGSPPRPRISARPPRPGRSWRSGAAGRSSAARWPRASAVAPGTPAGLALVLAALAGGHLLLVPASGSLLAIGVVVVLGGAAIAPTYAGRSTRWPVGPRRPAPSPRRSPRSPPRWRSAQLPGPARASTTTPASPGPAAAPNATAVRARRTPR